MRQERIGGCPYRDKGLAQPQTKTDRTNGREGRRPIKKADVKKSRNKPPQRHQEAGKKGGGKKEKQKRHKGWKNHYKSLECLSKKREKKKNQNLRSQEEDQTPGGC